MTPSLLCVLESLVGLAILCLILYVLYWAVMTLLGAFGVVVPGQVITILRVIAVLIVVILIVRAVMFGEWCGILFRGRA
jgi:hypothetical protein